jgi:dihydrofolate reductase
MHKVVSSSLMGAVLASFACQGASNAGGVTAPDDASSAAHDASTTSFDGASDGTRDTGGTQVVVPGAAASDAAVVAPPAELPAGFAPASAFPGEIRYLAKQGNVTLFLPAVQGAGDYRAFVLSPDVKASMQSDGSERIDGATIACAGLVQHNQCDGSEAITSYGPNFRIPKCSEDVRGIDLAKRVLDRLQLTGLSGKTKIVVEAVDALCPFPGAYGRQHHDVACSNDGAPVKQAMVGGKSVSWRACPPSVPIRTEEEIRASYGSLLLNGQAPVPLVMGNSPWESIGLPAPNRTPKVLARTVIEVDVGAPALLPPGFTEADFFESFSDAKDQPQKVNDARILTPGAQVIGPTLHQTSKLSLYNYGTEPSQWFVAQGTLRSVLADWQQAIMGSNIIYPRRAFALPTADDRYLHVTFEVPANATQRRYWWMHLCGAPKAGQTIVNGKLAPESGIVPAPSFMNPLEGESISLKGWNCIQVVPRGGSYDVLPGGPYRHPRFDAGRAESDLRVVVNRPVANASGLAKLYDTIVNVSPPVEGQPPEEGAWMRQWDDEKKFVGVMLDDKLFVEQRVTFDVYVSRGRLVLYADGVQKVCNDFPNQRLTMAEAAVGVGHVLYHSSAERTEFMREDWLRTGQSHYLHNLPFLDQRSFDNLGVRENAALPAGFREAQCHRATQ